MRRDNPALPDSYYMKNFISGLHESIQHFIQCHEPQRLQKAMWLARRMEQTQSSKRAALPAQPLPVRRQVQFIPNRSQNITPIVIVQTRQKRLVCNEKWFPGHRKVCKMSQQGQVQALQQVPDNANIIYFTDYEEDLEDIVAELPDQPLQISMHALMRLSMKKYTFIVKVNINGCTTLALIDSGSTATFISPQVAEKQNVLCKPQRN